MERKPPTAAGRGPNEEALPERFNALRGCVHRSKRSAAAALYRNLWIAGPCLIIAGLSALTGLAVYERNKAGEQTKRADSEAATAKQRLLGSYVEQGRQLLVEKGNPGEASLWLHRARTQGSTSTVLPYLLRAPCWKWMRRARPLIGHGDRVRTATYSPDGTRIVTASDDHTARVWEAQTGESAQRAQRAMGAASIPRRLAPTVSASATASDDHTARVGGLTGNLLKELKRGHGGGVTPRRLAPTARAS